MIDGRNLEIFSTEGYAGAADTKAKEVRHLQSPLKDMLKMFDDVTQPVFFAQGTQVVYANPVARRQGAQADMALAPLLQGGEAAQTDGESNVTVTLPTGSYEAVARPFMDGTLFFLRQQTPREGEFLPTLESIARTLRVPLTNLFGAASAVFPRLEALEEPNVSRQMASINRALYQLMHLSCNLGDIAAAWQEQTQLAREKTELCDFLYSVCQRAEPLCVAAGASLSCVLPDKLINAWIDRQKIERCILNLISNCMRHAQTAPQITVRLVRSGKSVLVQVTCSQSSFSDGALCEAFSRYATTAPLPDPTWGAGFGLPLTRHFVQLHGGNLILSSPMDGGAEAVFSLPLAEPEEPEVKSPLARMDYAGGFRHELVELADVLPLEAFDSENVN